MPITDDKTTFAQIKNDVPEWMTLIPKATPVRLVTFAYGKEIAESLTNGQFGIVLEGQIEIFEQSYFSKIHAYRPIKVLPEGSVFGDFAYLDMHNLDASLVESARSNIKEKWIIVSGRRCLIARQHAKTLNLDKHTIDQICDGTMDLPSAVEQTAVTRIAFINLHDLPTSDKCMFTMLKAGWKHVVAYRYSLNSYNFHDLLEFKIKFMNMSVIVSGDLKSDASLQVGKKLLVPLFADAIYDALNRPLRYEPVYIRADFYSGLNPDSSPDKEEDCFIGQIYLASNDNKDGFFFPIDIHNYFINLGLKYEAMHFIHQKRADVRQRITEEERIRIAEAEKTAYLEEIINKAFPRKMDSGSKTSQYFVNLADAILLEHAKENPNYPYKVSTEVEQGATRRMLLLRFQPK